MALAHTALAKLVCQDGNLVCCADVAGNESEQVGALAEELGLTDLIPLGSQVGLICTSDFFFLKVYLARLIIHYIVTGAPAPLSTICPSNDVPSCCMTALAVSFYIIIKVFFLKYY